MSTRKKGSERIRLFRAEVNTRKGAQPFDTDFLNSCRRKAFHTEWGKKTQLASWKEVVDKHGYSVVVAF